MEKDKVCEGRTYQSMRNRFLKNIFPDIKKLVCQNGDFSLCKLKFFFSEAYGLSASDIESLRFNMRDYGSPEWVIN